MSIKKDFLLQIKNYLIHNSDKCEDLVNSVNSPFYHIEHDNKELIEIINFIQSKELPNYICYATSSMGSIFHILYKNEKNDYYFLYMNIELDIFGGLKASEYEVINTIPNNR
jgi:hypothetical protein